MRAELDGAVSEVEPLEGVVDFDLSYLQTRCERLGVEFALGRGGERSRVLAPRNDRQPAVAR